MLQSAAEPSSSAPQDADSSAVVTLMSPIVLPDVVVDWGQDGQSPTLTAAEQLRVRKSIEEAAKSRAAG